MFGGIFFGMMGFWRLLLFDIGCSVCDGYVCPKKMLKKVMGGEKRSKKIWLLFCFSMMFFDRVFDVVFTGYCSDIGPPCPGSAKGKKKGLETLKKQKV